jgi:hypothetical protein
MKVDHPQNQLLVAVYVVGVTGHMQRRALPTVDIVNRRLPKHVFEQK